MATAERAGAVCEGASAAPRGRDAPRTAAAAGASSSSGEPRKPPAPAATCGGAVFGVVVRHTAEELVLRHADFPELVRAFTTHFWCFL
jgi:hypothetical protein